MRTSGGRCTSAWCLREASCSRPASYHWSDRGSSIREIERVYSNSIGLYGTDITEAFEPTT